MRLNKYIEFAPAFGFAFYVAQYSEYGASLVLQFLFGRFFIRLPFRLKGELRSLNSPAYGVHCEFDSFNRGSLHLRWNKIWKILHAPWEWRHVRHEILMVDGSWYRPGPEEWERPAGRFEERHSYTYVRKNGEVQNRMATIGVEEREWNWRWFLWLGWPRKIRRTIDINFDGEVGERSGSWKGGCMGCGYTLLPGETPLECLRRMERERKFT